jgi:hypothetical protein
MSIEPSVETKCKNCKKKLVPLNPPIEDYTDNKFCLNILGYKLMLIKDHIEMGCPECIADEQDSRERDNFNDGVSAVISEEIRKGNLYEK